MNKVGIYFAFWTDSWSGNERYFIEKAAHLGFDQLELCPASMLDMPLIKLDEIRQIAGSLGITLSFCIGFGEEYNLASKVLSVRANGASYFRKLLDIIHRCGSHTMGGIIYSSWPMKQADGWTDKEADLERAAKELHSLAEQADELDIDLCFEVVNRFEQYLINTAEEGVDFCKRVDNPRARLLLDTFHMNIEEDSFTDAIKSARDYLGHFHIGETNRRVPGRGKMPWQEICQALKSIDYKGSLVMEPFLKPGGEVGRDIKVWRDLSNRMDESSMDREAVFALDYIRGCLS